jgi:hypothetical protein
MSTLSRKETTALARAVALANSESFVIRPSLYRARLDEKEGVIDRRQRTLCGAADEKDHYFCGEQIAYVVVKGANWRELYMGPGWVANSLNGCAVWHPTTNLCGRLAHGHAAKFRKSQRMYVGFADKPDKVFKGHHSVPVTRFPAVAICCSGHINILEAGQLNVITDDDRRQAFERAQ